MKEESILLKIYNEIANEQNRELAFLKLVNLVKKQDDLQSLIKQYERIIKGEILVVNVLSRVDLKDKEKEKIEAKVKKEFSESELLFNYEIKVDQVEVLVIKVNDKSMILDF